MSERNYRIRTNLIEDKVVRTTLQQDVDFLEILSLKINQTDAYKLCVSDYGVIVGRVLGNDAFGIPNVKVSVFLKLSDEDAERSDISTLYPYTSIQTKNKNNIRYNLLPDSSSDDCYRIVGTFPNKRLILDNNTEIEIYEKYWKYTTVTNNSGDYMIFGVPTGNQQVHIDIDLSDIGILSQKPRDFLYKGYNITQFDNSSQFKESTNLDNLTQIISQNTSVQVYPFWGDADAEEIAISRCDIQVQYKFEPTCIFLGSVITDGFSNSIGHKCQPNIKSGENRNLIGMEGNIEMIRKTPENLVEQIAIQGNKLIDGDGIWCYQIPMNLDYIGTDEFGNIVPTDDASKGIPTKTTVRFRFTLQESDNDGISRHRARYLVPNNPEIVVNNSNIITTPKIKNGKNFNQCFDFGSATQDEYYRDLYWNKIYSVKNYIPRLQLNERKRTQKYSSLKNSNFSEDKNPLPFNNIRIKLSFVYVVLCVLTTILINAIGLVNKIISVLDNFCIYIRVFKLTIMDWCPFKIACIPFNLYIDDDDLESNIEYFPKCSGRAREDNTRCEEPGCYIESSTSTLIDKVQTSLASEYEIVHLDFYNDWLNGSLYFPLWFWRKIPKKTFFFNLIKLKAKNDYCSCDKKYKKIRLAEACAIDSNNDYTVQEREEGSKEKKISKMTYNKISYGIIKEFTNKDNLNIYYYMPGTPIVSDYQLINDEVDYRRLYATDIILLGSINSCDIDNLPNLMNNLPSTTANIPFIDAVKDEIEDEINDTTKEIILNSGMDWSHNGENDTPKYGEGLFFDLSCVNAFTKIKTCVNVKRLCELGVGLDGYYEIPFASNGKLDYEFINTDGLITRFELVDNDSRAMFASMNHNGLMPKITNPITNYDTYLLKYIYPVDFDGRLRNISNNYTNKLKYQTYDNRDENYLKFRFGEFKPNQVTYIYNENYSFPVYNNSFYFYFGIKEGNTAIEKFNRLFNSPCFQNTKLPFLLEYKVTPGYWCYILDEEHAKTDFGIIEIKLDSIKKPYSYILTDEFNKVIMYEYDMDIDTLYFGVGIHENGNGYEINENGELIKDARLRKYKTGEFIEQNGKYYYLTNDTYKIIISDANENKITETIKLQPELITCNYEEIRLGDKFDEKTSKKEDFCNEFDNYGEIRIKTFLIDRREFYIDEVGVKPSYDNTEDVGSKSRGVYDLRLLPVDSTQSQNPEYVQLVIKPQNNTSFYDCTCQDYKGIKEWELRKDENFKNNTYLTFSIWKPYTFEASITQYCAIEDDAPKILSSNTNKYLFNVQNGEQFEGYINGVPLKFILGDNKNINNYNSYFNVASYNKPSDLVGWFHLYDENYYVFPTSEYKNVDIWNKYVNLNINNNNKKELYFDKQSKFNILKYKFDSMMTLCSSTYINDNESNYYLELTTTGGKPLILSRCVRPYFEDYNADNDNNIDYIFNSESTVYCDSALPIIVPKNNLSSKCAINDTSIPVFNKKINNGNAKNGVYFATFTNNGSFIFSGNGTACNTDANIGTESIPYKADVITEFCPGSYNQISYIPENVYTTNNETLYPYFRGEFIDRRFDYSLYVRLPYKKNAFIYSDDFDSNDDGNYYIKDVAQIKMMSYNGIDLAYDDNFNIISNTTENLEYTYNDNSIIYNNSLLSKLNRKLYSFGLLIDNEIYKDMRNSFWRVDKFDINQYEDYEKVPNKIVNINNNNDIVFAPDNGMYIYDNNSELDLTDFYQKTKDLDYFIVESDKEINEILSNENSFIFDEKHYPTIKYFNCYSNLPINSQLMLSYQSCKYNNNSKIYQNDKDANNNIYLQSKIDGTIEESLIIDGYTKISYYVSQEYMSRERSNSDFISIYPRNNNSWKYKNDSSKFIMHSLNNDRKKIFSYHWDVNDDTLKYVYQNKGETIYSNEPINLSNRENNFLKTDKTTLNVCIQIANDIRNNTHNVIHLSPVIYNNFKKLNSVLVNKGSSIKSSILKPILYNTVNLKLEDISSIQDENKFYSAIGINKDIFSALKYQEKNDYVYENDEILSDVIYQTEISNYNDMIQIDDQDNIYVLETNKLYFNKNKDNLSKTILTSQLVDIIDLRTVEYCVGYQYVDGEDGFSGFTLFICPNRNKGKIFSILNEEKNMRLSDVQAVLRMYEIIGESPIENQKNRKILISSISDLIYVVDNYNQDFNRFEFRFDFHRNSIGKDGIGVYNSDLCYDYEVDILFPNYPVITLSINFENLSN